MNNTYIRADDLFRNEAIEAKKISWLGEVVLIRPMSSILLTLLALMIGIITVAFLWFGTYTKRVTVTGQLIPTTGLMKLYPTQPGIILEKHVKEGQQVEKGQILYSLSSERESSLLGETQSAISAHIKDRRASLEDEIKKTREIQSEEFSTLRNKVQNLNKQLTQINDLISIQISRVEIAKKGVSRYQGLVTEAYVSAERLEEKEADALDQASRRSDIEYAEHMVSSANHDDESLSRDIMIATIESFYKLQYAIELASSLADTERIARTSADSINRLFKAGVVPVTDKLLAETTADQTSVRKAQADSDMRLARLDFNVLVGLPRETTVELEDRSSAFMNENFVENTRVLVDRIVKDHPSTLSSREKIQAAEAKIATARAENGTTLSFVSSAYRGRTPPAESVTAQKIGGWSVGVSLKIPLFDGFSSNRKVDAATAEKQSAQADLDKTQRDLEALVYKNRELLDKETEHVRLLSQQLEKVQLTYKAVSGRYASGIGTVVELLKGQNDLADVQQQRIKAVSDWHTAQIRLVAMLGEMNAVVPKSSMD